MPIKALMIIWSVVDIYLQNILELNGYSENNGVCRVSV